MAKKPGNKFLIFILLPLLFAPYFSDAQKVKRREIVELVLTGNEYYKNEQFYKAASFYKKAASLDTLNAHAHFYLGESYRKVFDFSLAKKFYGKVIDMAPEEYPTALFYFPMMQKLTGEFALAITNFERFIRFASEHPFEGSQTLMEKAEIEMEGCYFAIDQLSSPFGDYNFNVLDPPVNTRYNDYAPWLLGNDSTIVFTSGRSTATGKLENNRYGEFFSDNFRYAKDSTGWKPLARDDQFENTNTRLSEGAGCFNEDGTKFYFTGCYDEASCKIYLSVLVNGKWSNPKPMNNHINQEGSDNKQPSLSPGADTLFFVSNRPGGVGNNDIWMSVADSTGSWGPPVNLGNKINTPFNEISPYYYQDENALFFASDGHQTLGGLDIFVAKGPLSAPQIQNIGYPFNSNYDDCYLVMGASQGYLASNRAGGIGSFDIYNFRKVTPRSMIAEVDGGGSGGRTLRSRVRNMNESEAFAMRSEDKFYYENLGPEEKDKVARVIAAKLDALSGYSEMELSLEDSEFYQGLSMDEKSSIDRIAMLLFENKMNDVETLMDLSDKQDYLYTSITITGDLYETATNKPASNVKIPLVDEGNNIVKVTTSNDDGSFRYADLPLNKKYKIIADNAPKKFTEPSKFFVKNLNITGNVEESVTLEFENIYFDVNSFELRDEAKKILDELIAFYQQNPEIQVEIFAYTDSTGSDDYNLILSNNRGQAAYDYLLKNGIDRTALIVRAQGKGTPAASNESMIGRQINRRLEFSIIGASNYYSSDVATFITRKNTTLNELAKLTGNSLEELQQLNGRINNAKINQYTPVRIRLTGQPIIVDFLEKAPAPKTEGTKL